MSVPRTVGNLNSAADRWLTAPEPNAAGRLGLFRILFALFYLWHLSFHFADCLSGLAAQHHVRTLLIEWARPYALEPWVLRAVESALVTAIIVLMIGYHTRLATLAVLILGSIYEAWFVSIDGEHAAVMLTFHIPFFMFLSGRWGETYSLDALIQRRAALPTVDPAESAGRYFLPARAVLVVLAVLFVTSAFFKLGPGGTWIERTDLTANILLDKNISSAQQGLPLNYLAPVIAKSPWLYIPVQYSVILFEASFVLALFGRRLRDLVLSTALIFHVVNALVLAVTFTSAMIVYLLYNDLQQMRQRFVPHRLLSFHGVPTAVLIIATFTIALAAGASWNTGLSLRGVVNLGGLLDWRTLWYPALPVILIWWVRAVVNLFKRSPGLAIDQPEFARASANLANQRVSD